MPEEIKRQIQRAGRIQLIDILRFVVSASTLVAVLIMAVFTWVGLRGSFGDAGEMSFSGALKDVWFWGAIVASFIIWWDPETKIRFWLGSGVDTSVDHFEMGVQFMMPELKVRSQKSRFDRAWVNLLQAAEQELSAELGLRDSGIIKANLLLLTPKDSITVVARSHVGSPVPKTYAFQGVLPAERAIEQNRTVVHSRIKMKTKRPYRSVAATPIAKDQSAYGAITVDSPDPRAFSGNDVAIDRVLRRYAAMILLSINRESATIRKCPSAYRR